MAGADTSKVRLKEEKIFVPENLVNGNKFLKWDEDSSTAIPVTLKVDQHGHFLYWKFQNKEGVSNKRDVDCLELTQLRDTRTGKYALLPKDAKVRDLCDMGSKDVPLENKTVTVVYGSDIVNPNLVNFCGTSEAIAQEWCEHLLKLAHNRSAQNPSPSTLLHKMYIRITLMVNRDGHIPVKHIRKLFSSSNADRKKVETALQVAGVHSGKDDTIDPKKFTYDVFFTFYMRLVNQKEIDKLFQEMGAKAKPYLTTDQLVKFLNNQQRDPRLNEILYPFYDGKQAHSIIDRFEKNKQFAKKGHMSLEGLIRYLLSGDNQVDVMESFLVAQDMEQPLSHYFIKSSHNTYLTGHQLTSKSSVEIYRQVLLSGCRCVELDCWDGKGDADPEPTITHGYTACTNVPFKDVIEAINEAAFKTSEYPLILSFENHCNQKQQAKMAHYCRTIFGDKLLIHPLSDYPLESGKPLPCPAALKFKILVKNKKRKHSDASKKRAGKLSLRGTESVPIAVAEDTNIEGKGVKTIEESPETPEQNGEVSAVKIESTPPSPESKVKVVKPEGKNGSKDSPSSLASKKGSKSEEKSGDLEPNDENGDVVGDQLADGLDDVDEESDDSDDEGDLSREDALKKMQEKKDRGTAGEEAEAGAEMSALVNYVQPVHFSSFETSDKKNHSYEISSFVETSAMNRVKENPVEFVNYNKRQLSRIYPKGTRVDSSNFMPQIFWNVGCQLVALNYQNLDLPMQLNMGLFNLNGRTGYILKPDFMRRKDRHFDPFAESTMDGIVAATVEVKVISGQFLSDRKVGTYVEVDMFGLPADTVRKKFKTKTVTSTGINPQYEDDGFVFNKVIMPKLAMLRIAAYDDNNKQIGHRIMPVEFLRPGYRHIPLRNELYQPLLMPSVFVHIKVRDYVPEGLANFADALVNPIQHQMLLEEQIKIRTEALSKLMEEDAANAAAMGAPAPSTTTAERESPTSEEAQNGDMGDPPAPQPSTLEDRKLSNRPLEDAKLELEKRDSIDALPPTLKKTSRPHRQSVTAKDSIGSGSTGSGGLLRSVSMGTTQFQSDAFSSGFSNQSIRSRSTPNLIPQEEIIAATVDEIKQEKKYLKVKTRLETELQKQVKKQEKKQSKLKKSQAKDLNKLKSAHDKARKSREKKNASTEKKMMKSKKSDPAEVKRICSKNMENLEQEQEKEMLKKQVAQEDALIELYRRHILEEKDLKLEHAEMLFELQIDLMVTVHEKQLKKLDAQHKKVEQDLRKMLGSKNIEEMKNISKSKGERQEISRLKREARKKHIDQAVIERSHLIKLQENKKTELKEKMKELQLDLSKEEDEMVRDIKAEYQAKCDQLVRDRKFTRLTSESNGSIAAIVESPLPDPASQNGLNGDMKKSASSGLNGLSDGPSSSGEGADSSPPGIAPLNGDLQHNGTNGDAGGVGVGGGDGLVAAEVEVHASVNSCPEPLNTNNSAQTSVNGAINAEVIVANGVVAEEQEEEGMNEEEKEEAKEEEEMSCNKDLETGECSKVMDSPLKDTPVVETTRL